MGATTKYTAGVWLGNFGGETVVRQTGSSIPAAIVRQLLDALSKQNGADKFKQPESFVKQNVCVLSGMAPTKDCPAVTKEYVSTSKVKSLNHADNALAACTWHYKENDRVKIRYPSEYQHWSAGRNMSGSSMDRNSELNIIYPTDGAVFVFDPTIPPEVQLLRVEAVGGSIPQAELFVDAQPVGSISGRLFWTIPLELGTHTLTVVCGNETTTSHFTVQ